MALNATNNDYVGAVQPIGGTYNTASPPTVIVSAAVPVHVIVDSSALPAGAATEATLAALNTKIVLGQALMAASLPVVIASNQSAIPISAAALPLPALAATSTLQTALNNKIPALGQATMANSLPVALASNQGIARPSQGSGRTYKQVKGTNLSANAQISAFSGTFYVTTIIFSGWCNSTAADLTLMIQANSAGTPATDLIPISVSRAGLGTLSGEVPIEVFSLNFQEPLQFTVDAYVKILGAGTGTWSIALVGYTE